MNIWIFLICLFSLTGCQAEHGIDGYKGTPWGISYEQSGLKNLMLYKGEPELFTDPQPALIGNLGALLDELWDLPYDEKYRIYDESLKPTKEIKRYDDNASQIAYLFYNNKFAMVQFAVQLTNLEDFKKEIAKRYKKTGKETLYNDTIESFKNGDTEVHLIQRDQMTFFTVLYDSQKMMDLVKSDIKEKMAEAEQEKAKEDQTLHRADMNKLN